MARVNVMLDLTDRTNVKWYYGGDGLSFAAYTNSAPPPDNFTVFPLIRITGSVMIEFQLCGYNVQKGRPVFDLLDPPQWSDEPGHPPLVYSGTPSPGWSEPTAIGTNLLFISYVQQPTPPTLLVQNITLTVRYNGVFYSSPDPQILNDNP